MRQRKPSSNHPDPFVILCAEEHPTNQIILATQLESLGYAYDMVGSGQHALEKWQTGRYPLVITNCHLPMLDGFELTEAIRDQEETEQRPPTVIIATTTDLLPEQRHHCLACGIDHCLSRPFRVQALGTILRRFAEPILPAVQTLPSQDMTDKFAFTGIDPYHLVQVIGAPNPQLLNAVLAQFEQTAQNDILAIKRAINDVSPERISHQARGIGAAAASIGAFEISARFKQIEANCDDFDYVKAQSKAIELQLSHLSGALLMTRNAH